MPLNGVRRLRANGRAIGSIVKSKVKGVLADRKRGKVLWDQGYGQERDTFMSIVKKGKTGQESRGRRTLRTK